MMESKYRALYEASEEHAGTPKALLQSNNDALAQKRLEAAAGLVAKNAGTAGSVLDVGCGHGGLIGFLPGSMSYFGIDPFPWIVEEAKSRYPDRMFAETTLEDMTPFRPFDVVCAIGVISSTPKDGLQLFAKHALRLARRAVVLAYYREGDYDGMFNSYSDQEIEDAFGAAPRDEWKVHLKDDKHTLIALPAGGRYAA